MLELGSIFTYTIASMIILVTCISLWIYLFIIVNKKFGSNIKTKEDLITYGKYICIITISVVLTIVGSLYVLYII